MRYRKASEIFPGELLKEIQKYSSGELVYIPKTTERKNWGTDSGAKTFYVQRNSEIRIGYYQEKKVLTNSQENTVCRLRQCVRSFTDSEGLGAAVFSRRRLLHKHSGPPF